MKILQIIPNTNNKSGGPVETLIQGSKVLISKGHSVEVVSMDNPKSPWLDSLPFTLYPLGPSVSSWGYCTKLIPWLTNNVKNYDVVIVRGIWMFHLYAARKVCFKQKVPYFVFTHGMLDPWFKKKYPLKHLKKHLTWHWCEYPALRDARGVLFTTEQEKILARDSFKRYKCNEIVVNYGTAKPSYDKNTVRDMFFKTYPELKNKEILLYLSRIHPKKGCDLLINAFVNVAKVNPNVRLVMAGPDQVGWKKDLEQIADSLGIANRITWTGMLKNELKWGAYYASKVFCLTSHQENFGIVVAEAMACGLPVLITKQVNIWREVLEFNGGLVANDNQSGANELLSKWNNLSEEVKIQMSQNAICCFEDLFDIDNAVKSLLRALQS